MKRHPFTSANIHRFAPDTPGVYYLYVKSVLSYVGCSGSLFSRLRQHNSAIYSAFSFRRCASISAAFALEQRIIKSRKPAHNRIRPSLYVSMLAAKRVPMSLLQVNRIRKHFGLPPRKSGSPAAQILSTLQ